MWLEEVKIVVLCSITVASDSQLRFLHGSTLRRNISNIDTSQLPSDGFNHIRRNGFELGFVRVPHYAKSQSRVNAVSPDPRQRKSVGLRSRSLLRHAMCYS